MNKPTSVPPLSPALHKDATKKTARMQSDCIHGDIEGAGAYWQAYSTSSFINAEIAVWCPITGASRNYTPHDIFMMPSSLGTSEIKNKTLCQTRLTHILNSLDDPLPLRHWALHYAKCS
ncbi:hypothetical protein EVAR_68733_1 [Eumeta japonica]|uniref:Uncharacterized protein n=1 Tax=Eumeta variegata TaxID=151549 RepID=A0A4C2AGE8_EUMVA|nr:hypothetical protein EVAR_68733_1 [Eumeta japonica]